jgi:hypothetical protein
MTDHFLRLQWEPKDEAELLDAYRQGRLGERNWCDLKAGDTHDVIHRGNEVVAVVVPIVEYQQLREALEEQRVNEEFDAARASYLARKEAGAVCYVPHEEARRHLGLPAR